MAESSWADCGDRSTTMAQQLTPFYPVSHDCTAEEAPKQVNKMTDSVYVSQSLTPVTPVLALRAINKVATVAVMEAMRGLKTQTLPTQDWPDKHYC